MIERSLKLSHALAECIHACHDCIAGCLKEEDVSMMSECILLDIECAEVCSMTLNMVHRDSHFIREVLMLCKNVCIACKQECKKHPMDHCQECYRACKACAIECENFLESLK